LSSRRTPPPGLAALARCFRALAIALAFGAASGDRLARAEEIDEGIRFKSIAVQGDPLGLAIGRYSADLEYLPEPHHALHVTPFGVYALPGVADQLTGLGGEVGYRFYSGAHGPHGVFAGASFIAAELEYQHAATAPPPFDLSNDTQFVELGGAIDAGYQVIVLGNFAVGAGVGAQYIVDTIRPHFEFASHPVHDLLFGWGLRPRILLSVGAAF
jgi:hypothetical protein